MPKFEQPAGPNPDVLRKRYENLHAQQIRAEENHKNARQQLDALKASALTAYGTDDLAALRQKLKEMEDDNARKLAEYQSHLDKIEADLKQVNEKFSQTQGGK